MSYFPKLDERYNNLKNWMDLRKEQGLDVSDVEKHLSQLIDGMARDLESIKPPFNPKYIEPIPLKAIKAERPKGPRTLPYNLTDDQLYNKMYGALLGRGIGCLLGIPVEGWSRNGIKDWAERLGHPYPLAEYFRDAMHLGTRYGEPTVNFLRDNLDHLGTDDDTVYTVLGLLILEEKGIDFTSEDVGEMWLKYLPMACTAEHVALENLKKGIKPPKTALKNNPFCEWIGADIRSDPWGYAAPGLPEFAADWAYRDASVSHIMNGTYGEMFFSAVISAAFVLDDPIECLMVGLSEIPAKCRLTETVKEALRWCKTDNDWESTIVRIEKKYKGMHPAHTLNNAAITVAGLYYGEGDFDKTISYTVMCGVDTDCTGATAGSIMGAILGADKIPPRWYTPFNDMLYTYINDQKVQHFTDMANRFCKIAKEVRAKYAG